MKPIGFYYWRGCVLPLLLCQKTHRQHVKVPREFVWLWRNDVKHGRVRP